MGSGSTKVMRQSEWIRVRARNDTLAMIDQCVTQIQSEKGLYCGEGGEEFLKRDRIDLEVYLEDIPDFVERHMQAFIIKRPNAHPYDLRQFAAYQLARLLWLGSLVDVELEGRFLLGLRDRHTPVIQLLSDTSKERKVVLEMDVRVNIVGDKTLHKLLFTDEKARRELGAKCAFAESLLDGDFLEAKQAKNPTTEFLDGDGNRLFRKKRVNDLPNAPCLSEFEPVNLPALIRAYYDALYRSTAWKKYKELMGEAPTQVEAEVKPEIPDEVVELKPEQTQVEAPAQMRSVPLWPVERDPYEYGNASYTYPAPPVGMWTDTQLYAGAAAQTQPSYPMQTPVVPADYNVMPDYTHPIAPLNGTPPYSPLADTKPSGNHTSYAGPMYQMYLPNQYAY